MIDQQLPDRRKFCQTAAIQGCGVALAAGSVAMARFLSSGGSFDQPGDVGASLGGRRMFPADNPWNQDVSKEPVDPNSDVLIAGIGLNKPLHPDFGTNYRNVPMGMPYIVVPGTQLKLPVRFTEFPDESDPGPYPIPLDAPIEGGPESQGDRHLLAIDRDNWVLYELGGAYPEEKGWRAGAGAVFDLKSNKFRPAGWTSANAAGLPVFPGLVRYDEVMEQKAIKHALSFTCQQTRKAYVHPARHCASKNRGEHLPPMGMRVRLRGDFELSGYSRPAQVILRALQTYGMFVSDNGGNWYLQGTHDSRWNDEELGALKRVKGRDFEVVNMGEITLG